MNLLKINQKSLALIYLKKLPELIICRDKFNNKLHNRWLKMINLV